MRSHTTTPLVATALVAVVVLLALGSVELGARIGGWPGLIFGVAIDGVILGALAWYLVPKMGRLRKRGNDVRPWRVLGLRIAEGPRVFVYAAAAQLGAAVATRGFLDADSRVVDLTWPQWTLLMTAAIIAAPIWEELLFRGLLLESYSTLMTPNVAVWGSAIVFAVAHVNNWPAVLHTLLLGVILARYLMAGGRFMTVVFVHVMTNAANALALLPGDPRTFDESDPATATVIAGGVVAIGATALFFKRYRGDREKRYDPVQPVSVEMMPLRPTGWANSSRRT